MSQLKLPRLEQPIDPPWINYPDDNDRDFKAEEKAVYREAERNKEIYKEWLWNRSHR
jgi:hypothetical protein